MGNVTNTVFGLKDFEDRVWDDKRLIFPHKCMFTGKWLLPGTLATRARMTGYFGEPSSVFLMEYTVLWTTPKERIMQRLKGNL